MFEISCALHHRHGAQPTHSHTGWPGYESSYTCVLYIERLLFVPTFIISMVRSTILFLLSLFLHGFRVKFFSQKCDISECKMDRIIYKSTRIRKI